MIRRILPIGAAVALLAACEQSTEPRVPTELQVDRVSVSLQVGDTVTVEAFVVDQDGRAFDVPPAGFEVAWTSQDLSVATVENGLIRGIGTGQTTVRATAGTLTPANIDVQIQGNLAITGGTFDLPILFDDDPDELVVSAQIGFSYSGHRSGTFSVDETFAVGDISGDGSYAYTYYNSEFDDQDFIAWERRADGLLDYMEFYVDGAITSTGTSQVYLGFLLLGFDVEADTAENFYLLEAEPGTVTVTAVSEESLAGTFTLAMEIEDLDAAVVATSPAEGRSHLRELRPRAPRR